MDLSIRGTSLAAALFAAIAAGCGGAGTAADAPEAVPPDQLPERMATGAGIDEDLSGDLRPEAQAIIGSLQRGELVEPPAGARDLSAGVAAMPSTIRVWRRRLDGSTASCSGRVDVIPVEKYVKGVLPHEWIRSWHAESLKTGAVAIRTYGVWWVQRGGKYSCADVDDTTASQVYQDQFYAETNAAADATAATYVLKSGALVFAQYSAENADPTADGVSDPPCHGYARNGHGHGTCQWGSQRWASRAGKAFSWILTHYYPGATVTPIGPPAVALIVDSDNANNDTSQGYFEASTGWTSSSATAGYYGSGYLFADVAAVSDTAKFYFYLGAPATKTIDVWWTSGTNRAPAAPYLLVDSAGNQLADVKADQRIGGGQWNTLGTWSFPAGWNTVMLSRWTAPGAVVVADAARVR